MRGKAARDGRRLRRMDIEGDTAAPPKPKVTAVCPAGIGHERVLHPMTNNLELSFRLAWEKLHQGPEYSSSTCCDLLAHLLQRNRFTHPMDAALLGMESITARDREVAATVIQWLGSNIGYSFVREALLTDAKGTRLIRIIESILYGNGLRPPRTARLTAPPQWRPKKTRRIAV